MAAASGQHGRVGSSVITIVRTLVLVGILSGAFLSVLVTLPETASAYMPRAPILIDGDGGFVPANGVTGGSGTLSDPYVIEGWEVNASTANGIEVRNTRAPFVIRDVYVHSGGAGYYHGVILKNVTNGVVANATLSDNAAGIDIDSSANLTVAANNVSSSVGNGIRLDFSANVSVMANVVSSGGNDGISVMESDNISIFNNSISDSYSDGVYTNMVAAVSITSNDIVSNGGFGLYMNHTSVSVADNSIVGNLGGIYFKFSENVSISRNDIASNAGHGIYMQLVTNTSMVSNNISDNALNGVNVWNSERVTVAANNFTANAESGVYLGFSTDVSVIGNTFVSDGVLIEGSSLLYYNTHTITPDNLVNEEPLYFLKDGTDVVMDSIPVGQLIVVNRTSVNASGLQISDTDVGAFLAYVKDVDITASDFSGNRLDGVAIRASGDVSVTDSTFSSNGEGLRVYAANATIVRNAASFNGEGIVSYAANLTAFHNNLLYNTWQAGDGSASPHFWDDGYPSGGNYWSDYAGLDQFSGPNQDQPGGDGIGDLPRAIGNSRDRYPLMSPYPGSDTVPPIVLITYPVNGQTVYATPITVTGTASDVGAGASGLDRVEVRANGGAWQNATGTSPWSLPVDLVLGTNRIEARAWDKAGNPSAVDAVVNVTYALDTPPTAAFTVSPSSGSVATTFSVDASSSSDAQDPTASLEVRWDWEDDGTWDTTFTTTKTAQHGYASLGTHTIRLEVRDTSDLRDETTRQVWVNNTSPVASFTVSPTAGDVATSFLVDAYASSDLEDAGNALEVRWDWEDDGTWDTSWSAAKAALHMYAAPGTYAIRLEARDTGGLTNATTRQVTVGNMPPTAIVVVTPTEGDLGTTFTVNASFSADLEGSAALEVRWDWEDDGSWDTEWTTVKTATHRYARAGTHTIRLEVRDLGGLTDSATQQVAVHEVVEPSSNWVTPLAIALVVLFTASALLFLLWRRRQKSRRAEEAEPEPPK